MRRTFDEHFLRQVTLLDGAWRFLMDPEDRGEREGWYRALPAGDTVSVPTLWNNEIGLLQYEGAAWYEKRFYTKGGTLRFVFEAVQTAADVWLDGERLGSHYGGFTAFDFIVRDVAAGEHTLTVRADSRFDAHSIPQKRVDWYNYGGIARDVWVERLEGICVLSNHLCYTLADDLTTATVSAQTVLYNAGEQSASPLTVTVGDTVVYMGTVSLGAGEYTTLKTPDHKMEGNE